MCLCTLSRYQTIRPVPTEKTSCIGIVLEVLRTSGLSNYRDSLRKTIQALAGAKMSLAQADWLISSLSALKRSDGGRGVCLTAEAELAAGPWQVMVRADVVVHR